MTQRAIEQYFHVLATQFLDGVKRVWVGDLFFPGGCALVVSGGRESGKIYQARVRHAACSLPAQAYIVADATQPGLEAFRRAQLIEVLPGLDQRFLHDIISISRWDTLRARKLQQMGLAHRQRPVQAS